MTQEQKNLLLKDLCSRLPYGVKVLCLRDFNHEWYNLENVNIGDNELYVTTYESYENKYVKIEESIPYLFPMSSMTEEQKKEYTHIVNYISSDDTDNWKEGEFIYVEQLDQLMHFYHKNHFDYRGLIEKGLAIDATNLKIY